MSSLDIATTPPARGVPGHTKLEMFPGSGSPSAEGRYSAATRRNPVDFAYAVRSEIGDRCVGAKINSRMIPLRTQLGNGTG